MNFFYLNIIFLTLVCCKNNNIYEKEYFVDTKSVSKEKLSKLFKYNISNNDTYLVIKDSVKKPIFFKPVIFCNVKPLKTDKNFPQKIFAVNKAEWNSSIEYFKTELKGNSISYLERNKKIVFRHYFQDNILNISTSKNFFPKNSNEVFKYLEKNKIDYSLIKIKKMANDTILDLRINNEFVRIVATPKFCESYSCYDIKDSINIENYRTIIASTYRW